MYLAPIGLFTKTVSSGQSNAHGVGIQLPITTSLDNNKSKEQSRAGYRNRSKWAGTYGITLNSLYADAYIFAWTMRSMF